MFGYTRRAREVSLQVFVALAVARALTIVESTHDRLATLRAVLRDVVEAAVATRQVSDAIAHDEWAVVDERVGLSDRLDERTYVAMEGTFTRIVSGAVTLIIGIYVFASISDTMPEPSNTELATATSTVESTTGQAFTLGAVAILVLVAGVILFLISGFGRGGGYGMMRAR